MRMKPPTSASQFVRLFLVAVLGCIGGCDKDAGPTLAKSKVEPGTAETKDGCTPFLSPSGRRMSFIRYVIDPQRQDLRGNTVPRADVWVRDLNDGSEEQVALDTSSIGWLTEAILKMSDGRLFDMETKKVPPDTSQLPNKLLARNVQWSPNGKSLVYVPDSNFDRFNNQSKTGTERKLFLIDGSRDPKPLDLGAIIDTDANGFLSWSPDGKFIAFHLLFFRDGDVPLRRIGVVDVASGKTRFAGEGAYCHYNWGLRFSEQSLSAPSPWDTKSERFLFVTGKGDGDADLYVSKADGSGTIRLTNDGCCKWSPAFDPSGRRAAFCAADWGGMDGSLRNCCIRVLDLITGEELKTIPDSEGRCDSLTWTPDGSTLVYDWIKGGSSQIHESRIALAKPVQANSTVTSKFQRSEVQETLSALASDKSAIVQWGAERAGKLKGPEIVRALRTVLKKSIASPATFPFREILDALQELDARETAPDVIEAFGSSDESLRCRAISLISYWKDSRAIEPLKAIVAAKPDASTAVYAAAALARMAQNDAWPHLQRLATNGSKSVRGLVASNLSGVPDPRSVDILIGLVEDKEVMYTDYTGEIEVGENAELSLATLTGETFDRRYARWKEWWKRQHGQMPKLSDPNRALERLKTSIEKRAEKRQQQFKKH